MPDEVAPAPFHVAPSLWQLGDPAKADASGLVGFGADLAVETLADAYRCGVFPWPHEGLALPWFSPDPRGILPVDPGATVSRSLRQRLRRCGWSTTVDAAFEMVIAACADRPADGGTWITPEVQHAYVDLHALGWAHSVEVWDGRQLVGGLYGVRVGRCFTGESMFHREPDASKVAFVDLVARWREAGGTVVDVQIPTEHLASLGVREASRASFLRHLAKVRDDVVHVALGRRLVSRLAVGPSPAAGAPG